MSAFLRRATLMIAAAVMVVAGCDSRGTPETVAGRPATATKAKSPAGPDTAADEKAIRELFDRYWKLLAERKGKEAVECMDQLTLDWYEKLREDALNLPKEKLDKQPLQRRLMILQFRADFDRATLARCTGRELLAQMFASDRVQRIAERKPTLPTVVSNGKSAHANAAETTFFFEKETDGWKLNETKLHESVTAQLNQQRQLSGVDENQFLLNFIGGLSQKPVDPRILHGPLEKLPG